MESEPMSRMRLPLQRFWTDDRGLSLFLTILALITFVVFPLAGLSMLGRFLVNLVLSLMLVSCAVATSQSRLWQALIITLVVVASAIHWLGEYGPSYEHPALETLLLMACLACFVAMLLRQVFRPGPITMHRVRGAIAVYLLLSLMWAYGYRLVDVYIPGALHFNALPTAYEAPMARYIYFSLATLTTLGYGDIIPVHPVARSLAVCEGLVGQLYPAILIAGLVGMAWPSRTSQNG
jgi:Ion channel